MADVPLTHRGAQEIVKKNVDVAVDSLSADAAKERVTTIKKKLKEMNKVA